MKGPSTELIHAGETDTSAPTPLTTPIYETTTFVFENAQEVVAYNEGRSTKHLYSRYTNPTVVGGGEEAGGDRSRGVGAAVLVGAGRDHDDHAGAPEGRRRDRLRCRHLRRDAAPAGRRARPLRGDAAVRVARGAGPPGVDHRRAHADGVVRVADQPDAALRRRGADRAGVPGPRRAVGDRQHVRLPDQSAAARARHRSRDAERDEISERPQRRHRRDGRRRRARWWRRSRRRAARSAR